MKEDLGGNFGWQEDYWVKMEEWVEALYYGCDGRSAQRAKSCICGVWSMSDTRFRDRSRKLCKIPYRSESGNNRSREVMKADLWAGGRLSTPESIDSGEGVDDFET